jgi:hypothetical protein
MKNYYSFVCDKFLFTYEKQILFRHYARFSKNSIASGHRSFVLVFNFPVPYFILVGYEKVKYTKYHVSFLMPYNGMQWQIKSVFLYECMMYAIVTCSHWQTYKHVQVTGWQGTIIPPRQLTPPLVYQMSLFAPFSNLYFLRDLWGWRLFVNVWPKGRVLAESNPLH